MPDFAALAVNTVAAVFADLGQDATWTPQGGQAVTIRVLPAGENRDYAPVSAIGMTAAGMSLEALASAVAPNGLGQAGAIRAGDQLVVLGESRTVSAAPEYVDAHRLAVLIETRRT